MDGRRDHDEPTVAAESFSSFLERIGRVPLLTPREESLLARRAAGGDRDAQRILLERNLRLVVWIAKRYSGRGLPLADLVQEGTLGLIRAIERFDWRRGCRLSTYATWWIRAAVEHAVESPGVTLVSLDDEAREGVRRFVDGLPDPAADDPFSGLDRQARAEAVRSASAALPELMRLVVVLRFGLAGAPVSRTEIAERLGLSEPVIRGLERRALERLRFALVAA